MKIAILQGNTEKQIEMTGRWQETLLRNGHEVTIYPFQGNDYVSQMDVLLHAKSDMILAYGLDILSIGMTGGDYYINKFYEPVLICLDEPLGPSLSLLHKRMNVTILFYTTIPQDVTAIRTLPQPLFAALTQDYQNIPHLLDRAFKDLYEDI